MAYHFLCVSYSLGPFSSKYIAAELTRNKYQILCVLALGKLTYLCLMRLQNTHIICSHGFYSPVNTVQTLMNTHNHPDCICVQCRGNEMGWEIYPAAINSIIVYALCLPPNHRTHNQ